jgi:hypothetical protein
LTPPPVAHAPYAEEAVDAVDEDEEVDEAVDEADEAEEAVDDDEVDEEEAVDEEAADEDEDDVGFEYSTLGTRPPELTVTVPTTIMLAWLVSVIAYIIAMVFYLDAARR